VIVPTVTNFFQAVMVSLAAAMMTLLAFIPALVGAVIILVVGWILSGFIARLVVSLLDRVGFEAAAQRTGVSGFLRRTGLRDDRASFVFGELVKWFIRLIFLEAAAQALHLNAVTQVINQIILFIPNLVVALIVLMAGAMAARFIGGIVRGSASEAGFQNPNMLATVAQLGIMAFAVIIALNQVGIAAAIVNTLFMALVGAVALAAGLAFGLGGRDVAARMWQGWYDRGREMAPRLESAAQAASERAAQSASQPAGEAHYSSRREAYPGEQPFGAEQEPSYAPPGPPPTTPPPGGQQRGRMRPTTE
jgi:hypothetical protein